MAPRKGGADGAIRGLHGLLAALDEQGPALVYLLVGEDRRECDEALAEIEARAIQPDLAALNGVRLRGGDHGVEDLVAAASTLPLLGDRRLVVVREPERLRGDLAALAAYVSDPCPSTCLVLVPVQLDRRLGWVKAVEAAATVVQFAPPTGRDLEAWIRSTLQRRGVRVEPAALALLVDLVQADTLLLGNELDKLALCCANTKVVTPEDVASVLGRTRTLDVWGLTNAIEDGDPAAALASLRGLVEQGAAVPMLVGMVDWCLGRLFQSDEPRVFPARKSVVLRRRDQLRGRGDELFGLLRAADRLVRTTGGHADAALERAVLAAAS